MMRTVLLIVLAFMLMWAMLLSAKAQTARQCVNNHRVSDTYYQDYVELVDSYNSRKTAAKKQRMRKMQRKMSKTYDARHNCLARTRK